LFNCIKKKSFYFDVAQLIKGESSFWINQQKLTKEKFSWQDDYWATGVSENMLNRTRQYIFNQDIHHRKLSFEDEVKLLFDGAKAPFG
jgi:putative transposase